MSILHGFLRPLPPASHYHQIVGRRHSKSTQTLKLQLPGNAFLGVAVWRSGMLPKWAGALWAVAPGLMYPLGLDYAATIGPYSTPPTVLVGAALVAIGGD